MIYMGKHVIFVFSVKNQMGPLDWICPHCTPPPPHSCSGPALCIFWGGGRPFTFQRRLRCQKIKELLLCSEGGAMGTPWEAVALGGQSVRQGDALRGKKPGITEGASVLVSGQPARGVQCV